MHCVAVEAAEMMQAAVLAAFPIAATIVQVRPANTMSGLVILVVVVSFSVVGASSLIVTVRKDSSSK